MAEKSTINGPESESEYRPDGKIEAEIAAIAASAGKSGSDRDVSAEMRAQQLEDNGKAEQLREGIDSLVQREARLHSLQSQIRNAEIKTPEQTRAALAKADEVVRLGHQVADEKARIWLEKYSFTNMMKKLVSGIKGTVSWVLGPLTPRPQKKK